MHRMQRKRATDCNVVDSPEKVAMIPFPRFQKMLNLKASHHQEQQVLFGTHADAGHHGSIGNFLLANMTFVVGLFSAVRFVAPDRSRRQNTLRFH